jgi:hypothetical protein
MTVVNTKALHNNSTVLPLRMRRRHWRWWEQKVAGCCAAR